MSWWKPKPKPLPIPEYQPPVVQQLHKPKDEGIVVEEVDTSEMTKTGIHRAWDRMTGRFKGE